MHALFRHVLYGGSLALVVGLFSVALIHPAVAGPPDHATVAFGRASLGERPPTARPDCPDDPNQPGPRACFDPDHDRSPNALDDIVPRNVTIAQGGSVTFVKQPPAPEVPHQVAVYTPGTDVQALLAAAQALPGPFIDIDTPTFDRLFLGPPPAAFTEVTVPFSEKGRYVVVCTFEPHLADGMYGWVNVQ